MKLKDNYLSILTITVSCLFIVACDDVPQVPDSSSIDRQSLSYDYFINNGPGRVPPYPSISAILAGTCGSQLCHGVGGGNGGTFKIYNPADTDAKNISNFISAQAQVIKGPEDTAPTVVTNNYPLAHTSPLLLKPLSELAGGVIHKGNINIDLFTTRSESTTAAGGNDYGEIYRWIAATP